MNMDYRNQFFQQCQSMKFNCDQGNYGELLKRGKRNLKKISAQIINEKYFESFNFYFSKPTNEMIVNIETPQVIQFKDYLYYDDINEFLKRPYKTQESKAKIKQLTDYYEKESDKVFPALCTVLQGKIMNRRYDKLFHYHDKNEKLLGTQSRIDKKQVQEEVSISNRVLTSNFKELLQTSQKPVDYSQQREHYSIESFETNSFNIFNPDYSAYSIFGENIAKYQNCFESNSIFSSQMELSLRKSNSSLQSSEKSELLMFQDFINSTKDRLIKTVSTPFTKNILMEESQKQKKFKKSSKKKKKQQSFKLLKNSNDSKKKKFKMNIKNSQSVSNQKSFGKKKKGLSKKSKIKSESATDMKSKLAHLKQRIGAQNFRNQKFKPFKKQKQRTQSKSTKEKKKDSQIQELREMVDKVKQMTESRKKKTNDVFINRILKKEQEKHQSQFKNKKVKKVASKKQNSQRYNPTPLPQSARVKKAKTIQRYKKTSSRNQKNSGNSKKRSLRFNKQKQPSRQGGQGSLTYRVLNQSKENARVVYDTQVQYNNFIQKSKRQRPQSNNSKSLTPSRNYDFKLNLNNLRMKIQDQKNPLTGQDVSKKAGFWSSRSNKNHQYNKKKKNSSKQKSKSKQKGTISYRFHKKKHETNKKQTKTNRSRKNNSNRHKKLTRGKAVTQSQPSLVILKKYKKTKRKQQEEIKAKNKQKAMTRKALSQKCLTETSSNNVSAQYSKFQSNKLRISQDNIQKTRQLIAKFKDKVKQKDAYYFYQQ